MLTRTRSPSEGVRHEFFTQYRVRSQGREEAVCKMEGPEPQAFVCTAGASALYKHPATTPATKTIPHPDVYGLGGDCRNSNLLEAGDVCMSESTP